MLAAFHPALPRAALSSGFRGAQGPLLPHEVRRSGQCSAHPAGLHFAESEVEGRAEAIAF